MKLQIKVRQWLTKSDMTNGKPVPMREMVGTIERETPKAYLLKLQGFLAPTSYCLHCGRELTHPVSLLYGIGPVCGRHFHINPLSSTEELLAVYDEMRKKMASVTWQGWVPKSSVESIKPYEEVKPQQLLTTI